MGGRRHARAVVHDETGSVLRRRGPKGTSCDRRPAQGALEGRLQVGSSPAEAWLGTLAERLHGPRGPRIVRSAR